MSKVNLAIVGVGNCASSLVQGLEYYKDADPAGAVPGLMHVDLGGYHVRDVEVVAAFDVDAKKVGFDLSEATQASENNTIKITDVPPLGVTVQRGPTLDGLGVPGDGAHAAYEHVLIDSLPERAALLAALLLGL